MKVKTILIIALLVTFSIQGYSQSKIRQFIGVSGDNILLRGSYDGSSYFSTTNEIILVPRLDAGFGAGIQYGFNLGGGEFSFGYRIEKAGFTTVEPTISGTGTIHLIQFFGLKLFLAHSQEKKFRPYLDIDMTGSVAHFKDIAYTGPTITDLKPANYGGIIFGAGLGGLVMLNSSLALDLRVLPEFYIGTDIKAKGSDRSEIKKFNNFMLLNSIGLNYYFGLKK